jgi:hypothetical protein
MKVFDTSKNSGDIKITVVRALHISTLRLTPPKQLHLYPSFFIIMAHPP